MCKALRELMKPEMDEAMDEKVKSIAIGMIHAGKLSEQEIVDYTGLTFDQVKKMREQEMDMA